MANPWFRMYAEFAADPKVQMMSETMQRRFIMLLCIRCSNDKATFQDEDVTFHLRISNEEWAETKALFVQRGLITPTCAIVAWSRRQFVSDSSTSRVYKHREKKKRQCNVSVTPPDTDTDTETEKRKSKGASAFSLPDWIPSEAWNGFTEMRVRVRKPMTGRARAMIVSELGKLRDAGHSVGAVLDQSTRNNWADVYPLKARGSVVSIQPEAAIARAV